MTAIFQLKHRALTRFSGEQASDFLNDLITADTETLEPGVVRPSMLLTPQGRILFDLLISRDGDDLILEGDAARRDDFIKKMKMYRLRRPVDITPDDRPVYALIDAPDGLADSRFEGKVMRFYGARNDASAGDTEWQAYRYQFGVAEGQGDLPPEKALPLEARLDLNHGISFEKGCYIGQEVTARTRYRGLVKRCYLPIRLNQLVETPCDISLDGRNAGQIMALAQDDHGVIGLAAIRLDALDIFGGEQDSGNNSGDLMAGSVAVKPLFPDRLMPLPATKK